MKGRFPFTVLAALAVSAFVAAPASATKAFSLRVEGPNTTLDAGTLYAPGSPLAPRGVQASSGNCVRGSGVIPLPGQTALGLVAAAAEASGPLQPLLVAEDSFGRRLCRVGAFNETDTPSFTGWVYRVNHVFGQVSGEITAIAKSDRVLWYFADFGNSINTGDELGLSAPVRSRPGNVPVTVTAYTFEGVASPAPDGTVVTGGTSPVTTVGGTALVPVAPGIAPLRAIGPGAAPDEIPSNVQEVCVATELEQCPPKRGLRIVGTNTADSFRGGAGFDTIRSRGGPDKVKVRGGAVDRVNCGNGKDIVIAGPEDRLKGCEKVRAKGDRGGKGKKKGDDDKGKGNG
jgi:hypothetical protein